MNILNEKLISRLNNNVSKKFNNENDIVDINNLYGVFLHDDNNKFIICKEKKFLEDSLLIEFFTGEIIDNSEVRFYKTICPWRDTRKLYSVSLLKTYFCLPLIVLLNKHHKDGKVNKKDLAYLYCLINEYLKKNPKFINELLENEKIR